MWVAFSYARRKSECVSARDNVPEFPRQTQNIGTVELVTWVIATTVLQGNVSYNVQHPSRPTRHHSALRRTLHDVRSKNTTRKESDTLQGKQNT